MISRRSFVIGAGAGTALVAAPTPFPSATAAAGPTSGSFAGSNGPASTVTVTGPITGGQRGHAFGGFVGDALGANGYVEEEYFVSGTAKVYRPVGDLTPDGRWEVVPDDRADYTTRVVVHKPADPSRFNGVVIFEWTNVSAFFDVSNAVNERYYKSGFAYAAISAQWVGVEGLESEPQSGLRRWDPERYGELHHPGDGFSYDIFTQVARAVVSAPGTTGASALDGMRAKHCIAMGESQSASRLVTYINAIHPIARFFTGFISCVQVRGGCELYNPEIVPGESKEEFTRRRDSRTILCDIRDDLRTPVLTLNSETEVRYYRRAPQPDSKWLRVWEVAGAVHGSACDVGYRPDTSERDGVSDPFGRSKHRMVPFMPTIEAASLGMVRWVNGGAPLPRQPRLLRGKSLSDIELDARGNALGGVRLPELDVPTALFDAKSSPAFGVRTPFSSTTIRNLYPTDDDYLRAVRASVDASLVSDLILPSRADEYLSQAARGPIAAG